MNITELLNPKPCSCGKIHRCDIKYVFIGENAVAHLSEMAEGFNNILIVADENTYRAAGKQSEAALLGKNITRQIFSGESVLIPDERAIAAVKAKLCKTELIIGIGSGVIQDLCKYISHFEKIPYYVVATAPSMDGYASSGAAMITGGMKVTYSAKVPDGFIGDTSVLKDAPLEMIKAGYGDIIGKYSALNDWKLGAAVYGEYFCDYVYDLTYDMLREVLPLAEKLQNRDPEAIKTLTEALIGVGIAMAYAENSRPASGSEHHLSHFFEITGILNGEEYFPHGIDVVYSTYITAKLREKLREASLPEKQYEMADDEFNSEIKRVYSDISDSCISLHEKTGWYSDDRLSVYKEKWSEIKEILAEMPEASKIKEIISNIGLDINEFYSAYKEEKLADAVTFAKDLKDRFSVLWTYYDIFGKEVEL